MTRKKILRPATPTTLAAVDLGSNSFHMIIARMVKGQMRTLDRLREMVQLAAGLSGRNHLTLPAQRRALACLERFGQRLRALPPGSVRAVGTNTLRVARNSQQFLKAAQRVLGHPIEIIAGREEARLIYLGVAHKQANDNQRRLVVDIGGGSTEFIIGHNFEALLMESVGVGCVSSSLNYFPGGKLTRANFERAEIAARQELQPIAAQYRAQGWDVCLGSSGTVKMVQDVVNAQRWRGDITLAHLRKIRKQLIAAGTTSRLKLEGLRSERTGVFPGGVAILLAAFESLGIKRMRFSEGALREGLIYDLLGRMRHNDVRDQTVKNLSTLYHIDATHAARVERTALHCLAQLDSPAHIYKHTDILKWAARLHEIGMAVSHSQYRKHGAYIIGNADMLGFSRQDQQVLAALILGQRGKFPIAILRSLPGDMTKTAQRLCVILRLAVLLNRSRTTEALPKFNLRATNQTLQIKFPRGWLKRHPLTQAELAQEIKYLKPAKIQLKISPV